VDDLIFTKATYTETSLTVAIKPRAKVPDSAVAGGTDRHNKDEPIISSVIVESAAASTSKSETIMTATIKSSTVERRIGISTDIFFVAREVIESLLDNRDFLGYQLALANGCMDEAQFEEIADKYLAIQTNSDAALAKKSALLAALVPRRFDADLVSVALKCDIEQAERAIELASGAMDQILPATPPGNLLEK
jgi:hypothetical protein